MSITNGVLWETIVPQRFSNCGSVPLRVYATPFRGYAQATHLALKNNFYYLRRDSRGYAKFFFEKELQCLEKV